MSLKIPLHDVNLEPFMSGPPDFNRKSLRLLPGSEFQISDPGSNPAHGSGKTISHQDM